MKRAGRVIMLMRKVGPSSCGQRRLTPEKLGGSGRGVGQSIRCVSGGGNRDL